jgi:hypothetical protein
MSTRARLLGSCGFVILAVSACTIADIEHRNERAALEIGANKEQANEIIQAIDSYKQDHDGFPESLDVLVPTYLSEIARTITGQDFVYEVHDLQGYYLCFDPTSKSNVRCCYHRRLEIWDCSMGVPH